jgi:hypothetical protein
MNERIKLLAEQAKFAIDVSNDPNSPPWWWGAGHNDRFEKFAQLIVKECMDIARNVGNISEPYDWAPGRCYEIEQRIQDRFGVEE